MRRVFALFVCILIFLPSLNYALNLDTNIYIETEDRGKDFGDIKAEPGDFIEAFIYIENENQDRDDGSQEIDDIAVTLTIEEIDEGSDIEGEYDDFDLKPRKKETLPFSFNIPLRVEDRKYPINIEIEATEDNVDFTTNEEFFVDVNKERHNLYFSKLSFLPDKIGYKGVSYLEIELYNIGTEEEDITITVKNEEIGFSLQRNFQLEEYPGEDIYENRIPVKMEPDAESGRYTFEFLVSYDNGNLLLNKLVYLDVECRDKEISEELAEGKETEHEDGGDIEINTMPDDSPRTESQQIVVKSDNKLLVTLIILAGILILMIIPILILKRR
ncbi:MAG: hypothetical protein KAK00_03760 [Nanoarchaeota archaeon]|nr:hypothetical protein [Nanoarchaeota archaeon]